MQKIRATLAIVWRIAIPYFNSEDKIAGRTLLAAVIALQLASVGADVLINAWRNRFYNALQEKDWDGFVREMIVFCVLAAFSTRAIRVGSNVFGFHFNVDRLIDFRGDENTGKGGMAPFRLVKG